MSHLPEAISAMTVDEKSNLLDAIWEDLAATVPAALSSDQSAELDRRLARYAQDQGAVIAWESVKAKLFKQHGRDGAELVSEATERQVSHAEWFVAGVEKGVAAADRGAMIDHEVVESLIRSRSRKLP